jgi:hypothetical protein
MMLASSISSIAGTAFWNCYRTCCFFLLLPLCYGCKWCNCSLCWYPKFETGGIVGGAFYGDKILARVNSGEMIANSEQQNAFIMQWVVVVLQ